MSCDHGKLQMELETPLFDEKRAKGFTQSQVRHMWPRAEVVCPECKELLVRYASFAHFVYGGW